ncbi:MAG TPA: POTRA domain-containing protein, partial [Flavobacterium sp.]|nr:POTRA domain-containing protein [Flavobacterium sp.]
MKRSYSILLVMVWLLAACTGLKSVPEGDLLYTGAKVTVKGDAVPKKERKALQAELKELPRPQPNRKFLWMRPKLFFYNLAGDVKKDKGFRHWLKFKVGEPPVLFSKVDLDYNGSVLANRSENNGFFKTIMSVDSTRKGKTARADYTVSVGPRYRIRNVEFPLDSTQGIEKAIGNTVRRTFLKKGEPYSLETIKAERERIDQRLKQRGYYYFNPDYLLVEVDSTVGKYEVDLTVRVKSEAPKKALVPYRIHNIVVYPNFSLNDSITDQDVVEKSFKDFSIIDPERTFNPRVFDRVLLFRKNDLYNRRNHNLSLNRLVNLGTFKFVKNEFRPAKDTIGDFLDAYYFLTPLPPKSIQV